MLSLLLSRYYLYGYIWESQNELLLRGLDSNQIFIDNRNSDNFAKLSDFLCGQNTRNFNVSKYNYQNLCRNIGIPLLVTEKFMLVKTKPMIMSNRPFLASNYKIINFESSSKNSFDGRKYIDLNDSRQVKLYQNVLSKLGFVIKQIDHSKLNSNFNNKEPDQNSRFSLTFAVNERKVGNICGFMGLNSKDFRKNNDRCLMRVCHKSAGLGPEWGKYCRGN